MISKADNIEDLESLVDESDKMAQIGPRVEIKGMKSIVMKKLIEGKVFKRLLNVVFAKNVR